MKKISLILSIALCALVACSDKPSSTKKETGAAPGAAEVLTGSPTEVVQKTIQRYNQLLAEGYQKLNMTGLQEVATEKLALDAYYHASALAEGKSRMVSRVTNIDFIKVDFDQPTKARVVTKETWDFAYQDIQTGAKKQEVKDYVYHVAYGLENSKGKWVINEITASGEDRKEIPSWNKIFQDAKAPGGQTLPDGKPAGHPEPAGQPQAGSGQMPAGHPQLPPQQPGK